MSIDLVYKEKKCLVESGKVTLYLKKRNEAIDHAIKKGLV